MCGKGVPWATSILDTWYHQYIAFPLQALTAAIALSGYTITDRGTLLSLDDKLQSLTSVIKASSDNATDPLLHPCRLLIGTQTAKGILRKLL
jgi:hypothetical protein